MSKEPVAPTMSGSQPMKPGALKHARSPQGSPNPGEAKAKEPRKGDEVGMDVGVVPGLPGGTAGFAGEVGTSDLPGHPPEMSSLLSPVSAPISLPIRRVRSPPRTSSNNYRT